MRIFILFVAMLAVFCGVVSTFNFLEGDPFWGWVFAVCVALNLANIGCCLYTLEE